MVSAMKKNDVLKIGIRYVCALFVMVFGLKIIYFLISPLTFKLSYWSLWYYHPTLISNASFIIQNNKLNFISACTAASAYLLLVLLTLTTKMELKKSVKVFLLGILLIFIANIIRIDVLIITLIEFGSKAFETIHLLFWKILSSIYVVLVWIFLTKIFKIEKIPIYSDSKEIYKLYKRSQKNSKN